MMKKMYFINGKDIYATDKYLKKQYDEKIIFTINKAAIKNIDRSLQYSFGYFYPKEYVFDVNVFSSKEKAMDKIKNNVVEQILLHFKYFIKYKEIAENSIKNIKILEI